MIKSNIKSIRQSVTIAGGSILLNTLLQPVEVTVMTRSRGSWEGEGSWGRRGSWRRREEEDFYIRNHGKQSQPTISSEFYINDPVLV